MKTATAYKRGEKVFLHADSQTTAGVWILDQPVSSVDVADTWQLGQNILMALKHSKTGVAHPTVWKGSFDPILKLAAVKTWSKFMKPAQCVLIHCDEDCASFIPTRNLGAAGGFEHIHTKARSAQLPVDADILGKALLLAFDEAE